VKLPLTTKDAKNVPKHIVLMYFLTQGANSYENRATSTRVTSWLWPKPYLAGYGKVQVLPPVRAYKTEGGRTSSRKACSTFGGDYFKASGAISQTPLAGRYQL